MNSISLFYEIFRMRYSMEEIQRSFANRYSICLMGCEEDCMRMREWMGEYSLSSGVHPEKNLCIAPIPEDEDEAYQYRNMDAIVCHLGVEAWPVGDFADLVACMPVGVPIIYICEPVAWEGEFEAYAAANLPEVLPLRAGHEEKHFAMLLFRKFPRLGFRLARDYQNLRDLCIDSLIGQAANRMALVAAASSVSVNVPVLGQLVSLLASPVETMAITAEQLRLVLYIGALYGKPLDFFDRVNELWMVVGGGWGWRTLARQVVGFIPGAGFMAKAAVAWAGTFAVGELSRRFYELGEVMPVSVCEIVADNAKRKVARAAKMKFRGNELEVAVEDMLSSEPAVVKAEPIPVEIEEPTIAPAPVAVKLEKQEAVVQESTADADTLTEEDGIPVVDDGEEDSAAEVASEPVVALEKGAES